MTLDANSFKEKKAELNDFASRMRQIIDTAKYERRDIDSIIERLQNFSEYFNACNDDELDSSFESELLKINNLIETLINSMQELQSEADKKANAIITADLRVIDEIMLSIVSEAFYMGRISAEEYAKISLDYKLTKELSTNSKATLTATQIMGAATIVIALSSFGEIVFNRRKIISIDQLLGICFLIICIISLFFLAKGINEYICQNRQGR